MTVTVLLILVGIWAAVLLPPYLRNRSEGRPADSISSFRQHLSTLQRATPGLGPRPSLARIASAASPGIPVGQHDVRRRRRDVLFTLAGTASITLVLAVMLGGLAIVAHLVADLLLGGYVYLLVQLRRSTAERQTKVRYLPGSARGGEAALLLRRSASR